ncbi:MAG: proline--tRNA ligase [Candidatus Aenigmarchaeota archaeon]|nr:proline--tRNA ligase [Candidatus Aenigmarchaeota archaeon]
MAEKSDTEKSLGIGVKKSEDFSKWYNEVVLKAGLADFAAAKGFMVIRPHGYHIWERIKEFLDAEFKRTGHKNVYFPALIPEKFLRREQEHVEGFAPEVFWVSETSKELNEKFALRPTSETIVYDSYSRWIRSWRDLPILYNLWNSVFRAETKMTKLFIRTREFLWQEGHTVHATKDEADAEVERMLGIYKKLAEDVLAIPVIAGIKTETEKFPGALYTTTIESLMPDGRALQMGTSHNLGQHFAKAFNIKFMDKDNTEKYVWQACWGVSTRLIGALIMVHGDDKGLVLPPKLADTQIVIIPIFFKNSEQKILQRCKETKDRLEKAGFLVELDDREYSPGFKFNEWELKGVPLRIEIGPKDLERNQATVVRRDTCKKESVKASELIDAARKTLDDIQSSLFNKAKKMLDDHVYDVENEKDFKKVIGRGMIRANWCGSVKCEEALKETGATIRCIPFGTKLQRKGKCIKCGSETSLIAYFAKAY